MPLKVGRAEVDITPPSGTRMAGFFHDRHTEVVHDPLFARAMVVDNGEHPLAFVTCDLVSVSLDTVHRARDRIGAATDLSPAQVMISATHTHTGPGTTRIFGRPPTAEYVERLPDDIARVAIEAWEQRGEAQFGLGWGFEGRLSFNRRFMMRSTKGVRMHPPDGSTDILYQEGKVDPEVGVLSARTPGGEPLGCLLNFACHVNVVGGNEVSADYPGYFAAAMKQRQGDSHVGLFANGCCANLCQVDVYDPDRRDRGQEWARQMGQRLADDVVKIEEEMEFRGDIELDSRLVEIELPRRRIPDDLVQWARDVLGDREGHDLIDVIYAEMTLELVERKRTEPMVTAPIQAYRLGDVGMVMLPGEIFVEFGLDLKLRSPAARTFVVELANGVVGYVPTKEAFEGGGYEQRTATSSQLSPVAGEMMVETGLALLDAMFR